jgi:hypothetical protein
MAKKNRANQNKAAAVETASNQSSLPVAARTNKDTFDPDYSYVVKNLKQIGILAVIFIAILVILSFVI